VLFLGSSCIYPKFAPQPIMEDALLTGPLEPTNEWYAIAKIAGIKLAQAYRKQHGCDFISAMPTNLYGQGDNFDLNSSHVMPALIRKAHEAKMAGADSITIWGTGTPRREFLNADDCADACVYLMKTYSDFEHVNVGSGEDIAIIDLARRLGMTTIAEGAEHAAQVRHLHRLGADRVQGYVYARPMPDSDLRALILDPAPIQATFAEVVAGDVGPLVREADRGADGGPARFDVVVHSPERSFA